MRAKRRLTCPGRRAAGVRALTGSGRTSLVPLGGSKAASVCSHRLRMSINDPVLLSEMLMDRREGKIRAKASEALWGIFDCGNDSFDLLLLSISTRMCQPMSA